MRTILLASLLVLLLATAATAAPLARLTSPADQRAWTVDPGWSWQGEWFGGAGDGAWRYAACGSPQWRDYRVELTLRLDQASADIAPRWGSAGWVWAGYRNNANLNGYEAGLLLRRSGEDFYRVMFSAACQEVLLWSTRGGFLQVKPYAFEAGKPYPVTVTAQGPHLVVSVDGRVVVDYWERTLPVAGGGVALGRCEGAAHFSRVSVTSLPAFTGQVRPHTPRFRFADWRGARWAWDGNEPIFMLEGTHGNDAKLVPGYEPQLCMYWYWINYGDEPFYANKLTDCTVLEQGDRLRFVLTATDKDAKTWLTGRTDVTVRYDAARNRYLYDHVSDLIVPEGHSLRLGHPVEFTDPVIHNHLGSASPHASWPTPHPWSVYRHESGKLAKLPHNHVTWYPGYAGEEWAKQRGSFLAREGGFWALVGDPVANPVFTVQGSSVPGSDFLTELCGWAFDVHMRWYPVKSGGVLQPGTYTVKWQLTSVEGAQGDAWLAEAGFIAPEDLEQQLLLYTSGIGEVEKFDRVVKWASPFYQYPWGPASLQDPTVGRLDSTSLRLEGPRSAGSLTGGSVYNDPVLEKTSYEVSAWVKTREVQGEGPGLSFGGKDYYPLITGTTDWQRVGFVCVPDQPLHTVPFALHNSGAGTVWFDDFSIRALKEGETPAAPLAAAPRPLANPQAAADQLLAWTSASDARDPGRTLLDLSGHGGHLRLERTAALADEEGKRTLVLDGGQAHAMTDRAFDFAPPLSFTTWLKPGQQLGAWNMLATGGAWNRAWILFLEGPQAPYGVDFRPWGRRIYTGRVVPQDQWSHLAAVDDSKTLSVYLNGELVKQEALAGGTWAAVPGPLVLGTWLYYQKPRQTFTGSLAATTLWSKALSAEEVRKLFAAGRK